MLISLDKLMFASKAASDFVNVISVQLIKIKMDMQVDKSSFEKLGIRYEENTFYNILVKVHVNHWFQYFDEKYLALDKMIKEFVDEKAQFIDWSTRDDIKKT